MTDVTQAPRAPERLHALDAVRGFALLLGVVFHATLSFIPSPHPIWPVQDSHQTMALGAVFFSSHVFRMTTFFLIAGFFAHMSFHRRGARAFIGDRLKRIAVPMVVAWPFLFASLTAATIWGVVAANGGSLPKGPTPHWPIFPAFPLTHLWFLYVLLQLYAVTLILRSLMALIDGRGGMRRAIDRLVRVILASGLAPLVLAAPVAIVFALDPQWRMWFGIATPDSSFVTNTQSWAGYGAAFGFGWLLNRQVDLLEILRRRWTLNLILAIVLTAAAWFIATPNMLGSPNGIWHQAGAVIYPLASWTTTFAAIGLALQFLSGYSPARRYIADASYWIYLIHMPIVMALQVVLAPLDWPWPVKFAVLLGVGFVVMFASYQLMVRHSFIGATLNGVRPRREKRARLQTRLASSTPMTSLSEPPR